MTIENTDIDSYDYSSELCSKAAKVSSSIKTEMTKIEKCFLKVAVSLYWLDHTRTYRILGGYSSITDYARSELGIKKSLTYNLLCIAERFGDFDSDGNIVAIDNKYKYYGVSKLTAMASLTDSELENVNPDMTLKDIKKYTKECISGTTSVAADIPSDTPSTTDLGSASQSFTFFKSKYIFDLQKVLSDPFQVKFGDMLDKALESMGIDDFNGCTFKIIVERDSKLT